MKLDGYVRVSRVGNREGESFLSPDDQRRQIAAYAAAHGHEIVKWHEDLDQTGGKLDRPAFVQMMKRVESKQTGGIIVAKLDRFARTVYDALGAIKALDERGAVLVCVQENFDPSTPSGRAFMTIARVFAELELERISAGWKSTINNVVMERGIQPTIAPFGYRKRADKRWEPDPVEAPYVKAIYERRLRSESWASIARWLNEGDVKTRTGSQWSGRALKDLIKRESYTGVAKKGEFRNETAHEPIVSRSTWLAAQDVTGKGSTPSGGSSYALTGLVRCAGCSRIMAGHVYRKKGAEPVNQYHCRKHSGGGECPAPAFMNETAILPVVEKWFFERISGPASARPSAPSIALDEAFEALTRAKERQEADAINLDLQEAMGTPAYLARMKAHASTVDEHERAYEDAKASLMSVGLPALEDIKAMWPDLDAHERIRLMRRSIEGVFVKRGRGMTAEERTLVVEKGDHAHALSGSGQNVPLRAVEF